MQVHQTELSDTLDILSSAFESKALPKETSLSPECIDCIRDSLQKATESFEDLYKEIRQAKATVNYAKLIHTLRQFRNVQMCLRVNKDRFQAQANKFYDKLRTLYVQDVVYVLEDDTLHEHEQVRHHVNETARHLHVVVASFGVCKKPEDPLLAMALAD